MPFLEDFDIRSPSLSQSRRVTVFGPFNHSPTSRYPVLFCVDGQAIHAFSEQLTQTIESGDVPPVMLIGTHSCDEIRAYEYLTGKDAERFNAHEAFFTEEVYSWANAAFGIQPSRESCGVFGFSNGGAFAISMGARHPRKYGVVIAFSIPGNPDRVAESAFGQGPMPRYYLSAGTKEHGFRRTTARVADILLHHGITYEHTERNAGHELSYWNSELPKAIAWSFP
jgi:enterochelin esterase-like enzyme